MKALIKFGQVVSVALALISSSSSLADTFNLDPGHSSVIFRVVHMGISPIYGSFNTVSGAVDADTQGNLHGVRVSITAASVNTNNSRRDGTLIGPNFFNTQQFHTLTFVSSSVQRISDTEFDVTGAFTMLGTTRTITVRAIRTGLVLIPAADGNPEQLHIGSETKFKIRRSEFGMSAMPDGIGDEIEVIVAADSVKI